MPVHVDAEELRAFAAQLKRFSEVLSDNMGRTQGQMSSLSETWMDAEFDQFRDGFSKTYPLIKQFVDEANRTVPALLRDADAIAEYASLKPE
jgi:uncharacterized protein YukE